MVTVVAPAYSAIDMARTGKAYNLAPTVPGTLGAFIRHRRWDVLGLTQEDFAARVDDGMTPGDVSQLERGKVGLPKPPRMIALARALDMHVCDLYVAAGFPEFGRYGGFEKRIEENVLADEDTPTA